MQMELLEGIDGKRVGSGELGALDEWVGMRWVSVSSGDGCVEGSLWSRVAYRQLGRQPEPRQSWELKQHWKSSVEKGERCH